MVYYLLATLPLIILLVLIQYYLVKTEKENSDVPDTDSPDTEDTPISEAQYGCLKNSFEEFTTEGGIRPINGYITWYFSESNSSDSISNEDVYEGIRESLMQIQQYMGDAKFLQVGNASEAQVKIGFYKNGQSGLPQDFERNTLAYAFLGNGGTAFNVVGDIFFNDQNFNWSLSPTRSSIDFIRVMVHEALHAVPGLHHQTFDDEGILYPSYNPNVPIKFTQDTIDGIQSIYGVPVVDSPEEPETPPTEAECARELFKSLFYSETRLSRLTEDQLLLIAKYLGIEASKSDRKSDTVDKIWEYLTS